MNNNDETSCIYLDIKTHQLASYFLSLERISVLEHSDDEVITERYEPHKIEIKFEGSYYNDVSTKPENKITEKKQVQYKVSRFSGNFGQIEEKRWFGNENDEYTDYPSTKLDNNTFPITFYDLETKVKEILEINSRLKERKKYKKKNYRTLSEYDRSLLRKEEKKLEKQKRAYIREIIGICKEHLFQLIPKGIATRS